MDQPQHSQDVGSGFMRGFFSSALNSTLMLGIFYGLAILSPWMTAAGALAALPMSCLMIAAVGIYGGVMGAKRSIDQSSSHAGHAQHITRDGNAVTMLTPTIAAPAVLADRADETVQPATRQWTSRADIAARTDRRQQVLNDGAARDKGHTSAVLAQEQTRNAEPALG